MNRGVGRGDVFVDDDDRHGFFELLEDVAERWGLRTHAFCLMGNHFHLLVEDTEGNLARGMRHVLGVYTQRFNRRHGRDGSLFRGRFRSRLVQHEEYLAELVRYIHMNPVQAGLAEHAGDYPWSSHGHYMRGTGPAWLATGEVMGRFGGDPERLDTFVHARVPDEVKAALDPAVNPKLLGDDAFEAAWADRLRGRPGSGPAAADAPGRLRSAAREVIAAVAAHFHVKPAAIKRAVRGQPNPARHVALLVCLDYTQMSSRDVARALAMHPTSVASLAHRYRKTMAQDPEFRADVQAVLAALRAAPQPASTRGAAKS
ncbi:MAG: transposase [Myxococcota bacterium]